MKLDVEGYEAEAFAGMSVAPAAMTFEFHGALLDVLEASLERLASLERYEYRITTGNGFRPVIDWTTRTGPCWTLRPVSPRPIPCCTQTSAAVAPSARHGAQ